MNLVSLFLTTWLVYNPILAETQKEKDWLAEIAFKNICLIGGLMYLSLENQKYAKPVV